MLDRWVVGRGRGWWLARAAGVCAVAGVMSGAASCGATGSSNSTVTVSGTVLKVWAAAPAAQPDVLKAERLALRQQGSRIGKFSISLVPVAAAKPSDSARAAIEDTDTIAYLGELSAGASADSMGITNGADVLQVSPGDTAIALTQASAAVPGAPNSYLESKSTYGYTFARVVPSAALEAKAQVREMQALGVHKLFVASDGSAYGAALALAVRQDASALSPAQGSLSGLQSSGADALFYAGTDPAAAARALAPVAAHVKVFVPSALASPAVASAVPSLVASQPGFRPRDLTASGRAFASAFQSAYGHAPAIGAIFGYEAMSAVLAVLREAGANAGDRSTVVRDFFAIRNRASALGTYSIDSAGNPSLGPFVFSRSHHGQLTPFAFLEVS